ncbi:MAG: hypothetical protein AAGC93_28375 [Cyanobacteria bacterium P01_F01_bin.53]
MSDASEQSVYLSARTFLAGVGAKLKNVDLLLGPIAEHVKINPKTVKDSPVEKLYDGFIGLLCGAKGMVEVNKLVRSDRGLQQAFGGSRCAEQSVIQETLDASTAENVSEMYQAMDQIYRQHSRG